MNNKVLGTLAWSYANKYTVMVARGDGIHKDIQRFYDVFYDKPKLVRSMSRHFQLLNYLIQDKQITEKVKGYE